MVPHAPPSPGVQATVTPRCWWRKPSLAEALGKPRDPEFKKQLCVYTAQGVQLVVAALDGSWQMLNAPVSLALSSAGRRQPSAYSPRPSSPFTCPPLLQLIENIQCFWRAWKETAKKEAGNFFF